MKLLKGIPKSSEEKEKLLIGLGWKKLKEPKNLFGYIVLSAPLMILLAILSFGILRYFHKDILINLIKIFDNGSFTFTINIIYLAVVLLMVFFHELIHLILIPNFILSKKKYLGFTWFGGFVYSSDEIKKGRYILITTTPFLVLSVLFPIILGFIGLLNKYLMFLIILNSLSSSVDILNMILIITQVPNGSILTQNGEKIYFKPA